MDEMMNKLYKNFYEVPKFREEERQVEWCHRQLIERLAKKERRMVLRIIDKKDAIATELSRDSFAEGVRLGWQLANALLTQPKKRVGNG